jgi:hypothetical protein
MSAVSAVNVPCTVCMEEEDGRRVWPLGPCGHEFCAECTPKFTSCPLCRCDILWTVTANGAEIDMVHGDYTLDSMENTMAVRVFRALQQPALLTNFEFQERALNQVATWLSNTPTATPNEDTARWLTAVMQTLHRNESLAGACARLFARLASWTGNAAAHPRKHKNVGAAARLVPHMVNMVPVVGRLLAEYGTCKYTVVACVRGVTALGSWRDSLPALAKLVKPVVAVAQRFLDFADTVHICVKFFHVLAASVAPVPARQLRKHAMWYVHDALRRHRTDDEVVILCCDVLYGSEFKMDLYFTDLVFVMRHHAVNCSVVTVCVALLTDVARAQPWHREQLQALAPAVLGAATHFKTRAECAKACAGFFDAVEPS